jgi:two-component system, NarL family, response regulator LiaR
MKDGAPLTVGVYDEPQLVVCGVVGMLARHGPRADVVTITPDAEAAAVDVLLCDPVGRAVQIEEYLGMVAALTVAPVLVFTWSHSALSLRRSMAAGARGFVSKALSSEDLMAAVSAVHRGETVAPDRLVGTPTDIAQLSTRETEVLDLICRGMSNLEIADELFVSVNSVKTYVRQVYKKIGVTRRAQAVAWGIGHIY